MNKQPVKKLDVIPNDNNETDERELNIAGFEEIETPAADVVTLGSASYTKQLGKIFF